MYEFMVILLFIVSLVSVTKSPTSQLPKIGICSVKSEQMVTLGVYTRIFACFTVKQIWIAYRIHTKKLKNFNKLCMVVHFSTIFNQNIFS